MNTITNTNLKILEEWINTFLEKQNINEVHIKDKYDHSYRTATIAKMLYPDNNLLQTTMKFHDIGRFLQFDKINSFDDNILSHYIVGKEYIDKLEKNGELESSEELDIIKYVIRYHMGSKYISKEVLYTIDKNTLNIIELSSIIDAIDNGCVGATYYIEREIENDEKHYKVNNSNLNMKIVSEEVLNFYLNNVKFNKFKYCKTYADYLLYAIILLIESLKNSNNKEIVISIIDKEHSIDKYEKLIKKYIDSSVSEKCILHLKQTYEFYKKFNK